MYYSIFRWKFSHFFLFFSAVFLLGCQAPSSAQGEGGPALARASGSYAVDGDTLQWADRRIRLMGIDAPEISQTCQDQDGTMWLCGQQARDFLAGLMVGGISCETASHDRYGRALARCINQAGQDLAAEMTRHGWALAYTRYSRAYEAEEQAARLARLGIWIGSFERPEDYRRRKRG